MSAGNTLENIAILKGKLFSQLVALEKIRDPEHSSSMIPGAQGGIRNVLKVLEACRMLIQDGNEVLVDPDILAFLRAANCDEGEFVDLLRKKLKS